MKSLSVVLQVFFSLFILINPGCKHSQIPSESPANTDSDHSVLSIYTRYSPVKIDIMPLTELINPGDPEQGEINLYISLLDSFGSQIRSPGIFRFELYQRVKLSAKPKGGRVVIWPDIDLTDPVKNNEHWRDFLRAYEFNLPFDSGPSQSYMLQATCLCPNGKRLSSEFILK